MNKLSLILSVVDPTTDEQPALQRAAWLAGATGAALHLVVCYYNEYLAGNRLFDADSLEKAREQLMSSYGKRLEDLAGPLRAGGLDVRTAVTWDHPLHEAIVRHAEEIEADLVFKDTHHHSAVARAVLSNTDWNLIRTCAAPLWLVKPTELPDKPVFVAAIDPMSANDKPAALDDEILDVGQTLSKATGAEMHVFHSYDPRIAVASATANAYIPMSLPFDEIEKEMRAQHESRFNEVTEYHQVPKDRLHLVSGIAHEELPELADELHASVVIMGAVSRNRLKRLFIGATAERTLEHLPCDLLIVKPDWFRTPVDLGREHAA